MYRLLFTICILSISYGFNVRVGVKEGDLMGKTQVTIFNERLYFAFYAVPYAKPPKGRLRFKNPKPYKKWANMRDATLEFYGACAQPHIVYKQSLYGVEDCLYLNIFTPYIHKPGEKPLSPKTVVVWVHGHAFTTSFSHIHGPDFFIDQDVVFVSLTHRIGAFGFLKLNDTDHHANMGLKDIVMGLEWIKRNIHSFGGNKDNVVLMGSGSGATYLSLLLLTNKKHLFSKMILQSGSFYSPSLFQNNVLIERARFEENLLKRGIKKLKDASTKDVVIASLKIYSNSEVINTQMPLIPFLPINEKKSNKSLLHFNPDEFYENVKNINRINKPILIGFNTKESITEVIPFIHNPRHLLVFAEQMKYLVPFANKCKFNYSSNNYKVIASKIIDMYFKGGITDKSLDDYLRYTTDLIVYPIYHFIQKHALATQGKIYVYKFDYVGNFSVVKANAITGARTKVKGASAGDEVCYLLMCEPILDYYVNATQSRPKDAAFIKQITELWTNFAKTGNPTPSNYNRNVTWPQMSLNDDNVFYLGKTNKVKDSKKEKRMYKFWNHIYQRYYERCDIHDEL